MRRSFDPRAALQELVRDKIEDRFDIAIDYHGDWFYRGSRIDRIELVRLFASVLHRASDGRFWLVTPVERGMIEVADAPFVIGQVVLGEPILFSDNLGREHALVHDGQLFFHPRADGRGEVPYLSLSPGIAGRLLPSVFYELVDAAVERDGVMGVGSGGHFHALGNFA